MVAEDVQRLPAPTMPGGRRQRQSQQRAKHGICEPELFLGSGGSARSRNGRPGMAPAGLVNSCEREAKSRGCRAQCAAWAVVAAGLKPKPPKRRGN